MKHLKTTVRLMARWLVILIASSAVLSASLFASERSAPRVSCNASCAMRCPCCVSKSAPSSPQPSVPAAPRMAVEKSFQLAPLLIYLLAPPHEGRSEISLHQFSLSAPSDAPLYQRHCAYLI
jgi:hypothetical protein